ncbi:hypothetical protein Bca4012_042810 [Brassica carinata]
MAVLSSAMFGTYRPMKTELRPITRWTVKCQVSSLKPAKYSSRLSTDIPLQESPQALFDDYLEDTSRVFEAMFPDKPRSHKKSEQLDYWSFLIISLGFIFLTVGILSGAI